MIELGVLLLIGGAILTAFVALAVVLKAVLWAVLLPIRLVFWLIGGLLIPTCRLNLCQTSWPRG